ncbi:hypothetical protein SNEBB_003013, partial [Seison nebaliae]
MLLSFICRFISLVLVTNIILGCGKVNAEEQWFEKEYELNLKLYHYAKNYAGGATITSCVSSNAIWVDLPQKTTEDITQKYSTNVSSTTENFSFAENSSDSSSIKMLTTNTSSNSALHTSTSQIINVITKKPQYIETTRKLNQSTLNSISTQFPPESTDSSVGYNPTSTKIVNSTNEETTDPTNVSSITENFSFEENSSDSSSIKMLTTNTSSNSALQTLTSQILNVITKKPQNP